MKVGISTAVLFPEKHTEKAVQTIKSLGVEVAEVFFSTFYEYRPEFAKAMAPKADGVEVNSVHALPQNFECNLFNPTRRVRGDGYYWLDQIARSAQLLGCKNYTFHGFMRSGMDGEDDYGYIGDRIAEAHAFMANYGVNLCIENTARYTYNRPGVLTEIRKRCESLYAVFDIKQARRSGYPYQMYLKEMEGVIAYAHLSDVDADGKMCLPGKGIYDFEDIIKRLAGSGFNGNLLIENYRSDFATVQELKESLDYLKEIVYKITP